jgi:hypothetical protein
VLEVPPAFFFEGAPSPEPGRQTFAEPSANAYVVDFLSTSEGLQLNRAFAQIRDPKVRKRVLDLVTSLSATKD